MPRLTEYELQRQENIRRNQDLLKSLGIPQAQASLVVKKLVQDESKENDKPQPKKRSRSSVDPIIQPPRRQSTRLSKTSSSATEKYSDTNSDPIDFLSNRYRPSSESPIKRVKAQRIALPIIPDVDKERGDDPSRYAPLPSRSIDGTLHFGSQKYFRPNVTPEEMLRAGCFGGTAFRRHYSKVIKQTLSDSDYKEFPPTWYSGLDIKKYLISDVYRPENNNYQVKAGQTLDEWEKAGWIHEQDPRGWFQWYCRFYLGRRTADDERQIRRWLGICGSSGRFRQSLVKKIKQRGGKWDDESISPTLRQTLLHWGYRLTESDFQVNS